MKMECNDHNYTHVQPKKGMRMIRKNHEDPKINMHE